MAPYSINSKTYDATPFVHTCSASYNDADTI